MVNLKPILFAFSFILFTLTGEATTVASSPRDAINKAIAAVKEAIDEAIEVLEEAIDEDPTLIEEAIDQVSAIIEEAINESTAVIEQAIDEQVEEAIDETAALIEQANDEDLALLTEVFNEDIENTIEAIANRLEQNQVKVGLFEATWPEEADFTGSIIAGMVSAYEFTGNISYKNSAEWGGNYILSSAQGNFHGDEAFALCRLSQISSDPLDNPWRTAVSNFYRDVKNGVDGTAGYISQCATAESSTVVFHLAYYVVAACYVDAEDKGIWREALINYLSQIDDRSSDFPVMALGIATWALAGTGDLDDTLIDPSGTGAACWSDKKLADLPALVLSHQVPDGELYRGSFYWRFDHSDGGSGGCVSGYTEDAIFATLGLISASRANPTLDLDVAIRAACQALLGTVNSEGKVNEHLGVQDSDSYTYGGEILLVLCEQATNSNLIKESK
ncbi:MAG: hypothetical protein ACE5NM_04825 [Sedimentisphaerales bacterium]